MEVWGELNFIFDDGIHVFSKGFSDSRTDHSGIINTKNYGVSEIKCPSIHHNMDINFIKSYTTNVLSFAYALRWPLPSISQTTLQLLFSSGSKQL